MSIYTCIRVVIACPIVYHYGVIYIKGRSTLHALDFWEFNALPI